VRSGDSIEASADSRPATRRRAAESIAAD
jgi:hypothetical protein